MSAAVKAVIATILTIVFIVALAYVEEVYTHGAITLGILCGCFIVMIGLVFYTIFSD